MRKKQKDNKIIIFREVPSHWLITKNNKSYINKNNFNFLPEMRVLIYLFKTSYYYYFFFGDEVPFEDTIISLLFPINIVV